MRAARALLALALVFLSLFAHCADALYEGLYCGTESCYDVLNVTVETPKKEVCIECAGGELMGR